MKKIFAIAALAVASVFGTANAGNGYIGGSIGFMHESGNVSLFNSATRATINTFNILPELGYNFNDRWAIGTTIGYEYKHFNGYKVNSHMFEFNPYARFSFFRTSNNLVQLFIDGGAGIGVGSVDYDGHDSETGITWNVGFRPGVALNFTDSFSMVAHLGFLGYEGANRRAYNAGYNRKGGFMLDGNNVTLGFYYNF